MWSRWLVGLRWVEGDPSKTGSGAAQGSSHQGVSPRPRRDRAAQSSDMAADGKDGGGQFKRFSGTDLDGKAYRQWKLWAKAKMMSMKDVQKSQRGPFVYCLLDGLALECVEHLQLEDLSKEDGDEAIWKVLDERFPDKMQHDHMTECLREVFHLAPKDGESMAEWTSKVTETFAKSRRKVKVEFPLEAQGWICLH